MLAIIEKSSALLVAPALKELQRRDFNSASLPTQSYAIGNEMQKYRVTGINPVTGRSRTHVYEALSAEEAMHLAGKDGTSVISVFEVEIEPLSIAVMRSARSYNIVIDPEYSNDEIVDLIALTALRDTITSPTLKWIAIEYGITVTRFSGTRHLFEKIFDQLSLPGNELELVSWFTYCVYQDLVSCTSDSVVKNPDDPLITVIARKLSSRSEIIASIRRCEGCDLMPPCLTNAASPSKIRTHRRTKAYRATAGLVKPFATMELIEKHTREQRNAALDRVLRWLRFADYKKRG